MIRCGVISRHMSQSNTITYIEIMDSDVVFIRLKVTERVRAKTVCGVLFLSSLNVVNEVHGAQRQTEV